MNELNPILDALNDIDTKYIIEPKRKKRPVALLIAASVAAITLMTGFTVMVNEVSPGVNVQGGQNAEHQFSYNVTDKKDLNILTKDELLKIDTVKEVEINGRIYSASFEEALPSDILKRYNVKSLLLGNDNFTEQPCQIFVRSLDYSNGQCDYLRFDYNLTHKKSGMDLRFKCYVSIDGFDLTSTYESDETIDKEIIPLNDGSMCMLLEQHEEKPESSYVTAAFSYNGIIYDLMSWDYSMNSELMKEILSDLGIL